MKDAGLRWFMSMQGNSIENLEQVKDTFMERYRNYCKYKDTREEIFKMIKVENESLEYFKERFQFSYK